MKELRLYQDYFPREFPRTILQIGCGGTGSLLVPQIARSIKEWERIAHREINYILMDGDKVEAKNIVRQNFIRADLRQHKAEVLGKRYSSAFGVNIGYVNEFLKEDTLNRLRDIYRYDRVLIVGCVDNHKTRRIIDNHIQSNVGYDYTRWVDAGNESKSGQVFISSNSQMRTRVRLLDAYPEIKTAQDKRPDEISCAERLVRGEQNLSVNLTAALTLFNVINSFMIADRIHYYEVRFGTNNSFTKRYIDDWGKEEKKDQEPTAAPRIQPMNSI